VGGNLSELISPAAKTAQAFALADRPLEDIARPLERDVFGV
jgi:hypothetical protein